MTRARGGLAPPLARYRMLTHLAGRHMMEPRRYHMVAPRPPPRVAIPCQLPSAQSR